MAFTSSYSDSPTWSDILPIPLNDGLNPLAAIAYTESYSEATSYLRAVMALDEHSPRVLNLTADIISMNPAHYTVWIYRMATLKALNSPLVPELAWLNKISMKNLKNYQIYGHRQNLVTHYFPNPAQGKLPEELSSERTFLDKILQKDTKNYHVWSYRQFLVRHFSLFDTPEELSWTESMIEKDVRNNSAWNHRWFLTFGKHIDPSKGMGKELSPVPLEGEVEDEVLDQEIEYSISKIRIAPQNPSPWNYLRGVLKKASGRTDVERALKKRVKGFAEALVDVSGHQSGISDENKVRSSHALEYLAELYGEEKEGGERGMEQAEKCWDLLSRRYDPIRKGYWDWRKGMAQQERKGEQGVPVEG